MNTETTITKTETETETPAATLHTYHCWDDHPGTAIEIEAASAREAAQDYVDSGEWGDPESTIWITVYVARSASDDDMSEARRIKIAVDPAEPACVDGHEHDWQEGQVYGSGGGVKGTDTCAHCGLLRQWDTWATDRTDGTQGHHSVSYERPGEADDADDYRADCYEDDGEWIGDDFDDEEA